MAEVKIMVGGRQYAVHCRDGEEGRLHQLAGMMSDRVNLVKGGANGLTEVRQLLFAGLLLADTLSEKSNDPQSTVAAPVKASETVAPPAPAAPVDDPATLAALAQLAERIEALGESLAAQVSSA
jgi:cell division protein ZapA